MDGEERPPYARTGEVDTVDGFVLVLSPWTVRNVRFDESLGQLHGYDFDYCLQVREAGRKVVTADFQVIHHHSLDLVSDPETWIEAHMRVAEKWDGRMPGAARPAATGGSARAAPRPRRPRPRRAVSTQLKSDARERAVERELGIVDREHQLAPHRAAAPAQRAAQARRAALSGSVVGERAADLVLRDDRRRRRDAGADAQARQPLGDARTRWSPAGAAGPPPGARRAAAP